MFGAKQCHSKWHGDQEEGPLWRQKAQRWDWQGCQEEGKAKMLETREGAEHRWVGLVHRFTWVVVEGQHSHNTAEGQRRRLLVLMKDNVVPYKVFSSFRHFSYTVRRSKKQKAELFFFTGFLPLFEQIQQKSTARVRKLSFIIFKIVFKCLRFHLKAQCEETTGFSMAYSQKKKKNHIHFGNISVLHTIWIASTFNFIF